MLAPASDLRILRRTADLSAIIEVMCGVKVRCVSKVTPNIFGRLSSGRRLRVEDDVGVQVGLVIIGGEKSYGGFLSGYLQVL